MQQQTTMHYNTHTGRKITQASNSEARRARRTHPLLHVWLPFGGPERRARAAAAEGGADIIELGMPFSDPLADGATSSTPDMSPLNAA